MSMLQVVLVCCMLLSIVHVVLIVLLGPLQCSAVLVLGAPLVVICSLFMPSSAGGV